MNKHFIPWIFACLPFIIPILIVWLCKNKNPNNKLEEDTSEEWGSFCVGAKVKSSFGKSWGKIGVISKIRVPDADHLDLPAVMEITFDDGSIDNISEDFLKRVN